MTGGGGKVWIVGAGPGAADLVTVRAARLLRTADDLVVDALVPAEVYAEAPGSVVYVGKRAGRPHASQRRIGEILVELALRGRQVVRLKGGDPTVFGRLAEEIAALDRAGVAWEVVPGVSSVQASAVAAGLPLTERDLADRFLVVTGHRRAGRPPVRELPPYDPEMTVVWLMPVANLAELVAGALQLGYPPSLPAVAVSRASLVGERVLATTLEALPRAVAEGALTTPATVLLGRVAERAATVAAEVDRSSATPSA